MMLGMTEVVDDSVSNGWSSPNKLVLAVQWGDGQIFRSLPAF